METAWNVELCWYLAGLVNEKLVWPVCCGVGLGGRAEGREEMEG